MTTEPKMNPEQVVEIQSLDLAELRRANLSRMPKWRKPGEPEPSIEFAATELAGEVGEACNAVKKLARLKMGMTGGSDTTQNLAEELGDVVICADLLAIKTGIDLASAVSSKFNKTSEKHGFSERLATADCIERLIAERKPSGLSVHDAVRKAGEKYCSGGINVTLVQSITDEVTKALVPPTDAEGAAAIKHFNDNMFRIKNVMGDDGVQKMFALMKAARRSHPPQSHAGDCDIFATNPELPCSCGFFHSMCRRTETIPPEETNRWQQHKAAMDRLLPKSRPELEKALREAVSDGIDIDNRNLLDNIMGKILPLIPESPVAKPGSVNRELLADIRRLHGIIVKTDDHGPAEVAAFFRRHDAFAIVRRIKLAAESAVVSEDKTIAELKDKIQTLEMDLEEAHETIGMGTDGMVNDLNDIRAKLAAAEAVIAKMPNVFRDILTERDRQIAKGFDSQHDDEHEFREIIRAVIRILGGKPQRENVLIDWTKDLSAHVLEKYAHDERHQVLIATAMLVAELERLDRVADPANPPHPLGVYGVDWVMTKRPADEIYWIQNARQGMYCHEQMGRWSLANDVTCEVGKCRYNPPTITLSEPEALAFLADHPIPDDLMKLAAKPDATMPHGATQHALAQGNVGSTPTEASAAKGPDDHSSPITNSGPANSGGTASVASGPVEAWRAAYDAVIERVEILEKQEPALGDEVTRLTRELADAKGEETIEELSLSLGALTGRYENMTASAQALRQELELTKAQLAEKTAEIGKLTLELREATKPVGNTELEAAIGRIDKYPADDNDDILAWATVKRAARQQPRFDKPMWPVMTGKGKITAWFEYLASAESWATPFDYTVGPATTPGEKPIAPATAMELPPCPYCKKPMRLSKLDATLVAGHDRNCRWQGSMIMVDEWRKLAGADAGGTV